MIILISTLLAGMKQSLGSKDCAAYLCNENNALSLTKFENLVRLFYVADFKSADRGSGLQIRNSTGKFENLVMFFVINSLLICSACCWINLIETEILFGKATRNIAL